MLVLILSEKCDKICNQKLVTISLKGIKIFYKEIKLQISTNFSTMKHIRLFRTNFYSFIIFELRNGRIIKLKNNSLEILSIFANFFFKKKKTLSSILLTAGENFLWKMEKFKFFQLKNFLKNYLISKKIFKRTTKDQILIKNSTIEPLICSLKVNYFKKKITVIDKKKPSMPFPVFFNPDIFLISRPSKDFFIIKHLNKKAFFLNRNNFCLKKTKAQNYFFKITSSSNKILIIFQLSSSEKKGDKKINYGVNSNIFNTGTFILWLKYESKKCNFRLDMEDKKSVLNISLSFFCFNDYFFFLARQNYSTDLIFIDLFF